MMRIDAAPAWAIRSKLHISVLWLLLAAITIVECWIWAAIIFAALDNPDNLTMKQYIVGALNIALAPFVFAFLVRSADHFSKYGSRVITLHQNAIHRAGFAATPISTVRGLSVKTVGARVFAYLELQNGKRRVLSIWFVDANPHQLAARLGTALGLPQRGQPR